jgi:hypothetical protein
MLGTYPASERLNSYLSDRQPDHVRRRPVSDNPAVASATSVIGAT